MITQHHTPATRSAALLLAIGLTGILSGCVGLIGAAPRTADPTADPTSTAERTTGQVTEELSQIPGVTGAFVSTGPVGLPTQLELTIGLDLEAGYAGDVAALLDYTLAMGWSATSEEPTTTASVGFLNGDVALDLAPVAAELGWTGRTGPKLDLSVDDMVDRYGPWPGPVPEKPAELG